MIIKLAGTSLCNKYNRDKCIVGGFPRFLPVLAIASLINDI